MKILFWILLAIVPGGSIILLGKWLKHIRETHYPDIEEDDDEFYPGHA